MNILCVKMFQLRQTMSLCFYGPMDVYPSCLAQLHKFHDPIGGPQSARGSWALFYVSVWIRHYSSRLFEVNVGERFKHKETRKQQALRAAGNSAPDIETRDRNSASGRGRWWCPVLTAWKRTMFDLFLFHLLASIFILELLPMLTLTACSSTAALMIELCTLPRTTA